MTLPPPSAAPPMPARAGATPSLPVVSPVVPTVEHVIDVPAEGPSEAPDAAVDPAVDSAAAESPETPESALDSLGDLDEVEAPKVAAEPAKASKVAAGAAHAGRALVMIEDGKVVHAPADVYVVDVTALTSPDRSAEDLFDALKDLREVSPSRARESLADRLTAHLRDRLAV